MRKKNNKSESSCDINTIDKRKQLKYIILCVFLVLLILLCWILFLGSKFKNAVSDVKDTIDENTEATSIAIPGYEGLTFKADCLEQAVSLSNPKQNNCYFVITLYLEDGTLLWQSDYIKPGRTSSAIKLFKPLAEGTYPNAVMHYSCYKMNKEKTELNNAEMKLTLWVK